ncbi:hypothetical protein LWI29_037713 [Acer saccharum]|uniref:Uncharacterized protein n=1 Tax=Acer saccharum TaxID=4024 RepID=A0AA39T198_ACESA|nr:hypothetical protein LWI29_037713 [Acer saccharum]
MLREEMRIKGLMGLLDDSKGGRIWILSDGIVSFLFHLEMPWEMDFKEIVLLSSMYTWQYRAHTPREIA